MVEFGVILVEFVILEEIVVVVCLGEVDVVLVDFVYFKLIVDVFGGELIIVDDSVFIGGGVGMGICEFDGELKVKMDVVIVFMKVDGILFDLIVKWFDGCMVKF